MKYSIITGFRNRETERVRKSLESLSLQTIQDFELIFVDYGSSESPAEAVKELIRNFPFVEYVYNDTRGWVWNRAHALNTGIRRARGLITILWDIDLVVEPDFLERLNNYDFSIEFTIHRCFYLSEKTSGSGFTRRNAKRKPLKSSYVGLCAAKTRILNEIKGYDEFFQVWGAEDEDLYDRLQKNGLVKRLVSTDEIPVYHQWHPTSSLDMPDIWYIKMIEYLENPSRVKLDNFGKIYQTIDRAALISYQDGEYRKGREIILDLESRTMLYNSFIKEFTKPAPGKLLFIDFHFPQMNPNRLAQRFLKSFNQVMFWLRLNFRLANQKQEEKNRKSENILSFFHYFLGTNRANIQDYYLNWEKDDFLLILVKPE